MTRDEWLAEGLRLQAAGELPAGVTLPEPPEPDWEAWREALDAFYDVWRGFVLDAPRMDNSDKDYIRGMIAARPHMPPPTEWQTVPEGWDIAVDRNTARRYCFVRVAT